MLILLIRLHCHRNQLCNILSELSIRDQQLKKQYTKYLNVVTCYSTYRACDILNVPTLIIKYAIMKFLVKHFKYAYNKIRAFL